MQVVYSTKTSISLLELKSFLNTEPNKDSFSILLRLQKSSILDKDILIGRDELIFIFLK